MVESKGELDQLMGMPDLQNVPILVLGNKVDKDGAMPEDELREHLGLELFRTYGKDHSHKNPGGKKVEVFMCSVFKKYGYGDGFQWLSGFIA